MSTTGRTRVAGVLGVAVLGAALVACGDSGGGSGAVSLHFTWWGNEDRAEATQRAVDLFEERNPGITVTTSFASYESYVEKLSTQVAGGAAPDLIQMDTFFLREYAERGVLMDLTEHVGEAISTEHLPDTLLEGATLDGALYALPLGQNVPALVYDRELWDAAGVPAPEIGWTWEDYRSAAERVAEETGEAGTTDFGWNSDWFDFWLRQQGKSLYTEDAGLGFDEADLVDFWTVAQDWVREGVSTPPETTTSVNGALDTSPLARGQAGSEFNYDSTAGSYFTVSDDMALAPLPTDTGNGGAHAGASSLLSVSSCTEHPEEAAAFVGFLVNDVDAGRALGVSRSMPVNGEVRAAVSGSLEGADSAVYEFQESVAEELNEAPPPPPTGASTNKRTFTRIYDEINFGQRSVSEGAARFVREAGRALR
ncbi:ABC transporter substrate-binding protein [Actinoalloteichus caeruleus]|uniref:Multiple sugar transport system substrate-binding protein n=1 Tax=Actinoalloteichus caeruleus DSM 43889 TaxID=1120930 RepID=A0ABT1JMX2_ACTCY|nr:sugar ABC transporter substrate-binding protein [Actinoalloteichus caeruleus]MCP2333861.1 multiple sugar transport system substrate-binding protein [Actinoalloteichus caeruleus DSM 43889]